MATDTATRQFSATTLELGDKIVGLTLKEAKELSDYLAEVHGIKPAAGGAVMMAAPAAGGEGGPAKPAEKTEFNVILESFGDKKDRRDQGSPGGNRSGLEGSKGSRRGLAR